MAIDRVIAPPGCFHHVVNGHDAYAHVVSSTRKRMIFISGQLARDEDGHIIGPGDMRAQLDQVGKNLVAALAAVGAGLDDLVKTTTYVTDMAAFFEAIDVRHIYLGSTLPTSTTVAVAALAHPDAMIEIDAIAMLME